MPMSPTDQRTGPGIPEPDAGSALDASAFRNLRARMFGEKSSPARTVFEPAAETGHMLNSWKSPVPSLLAVAPEPSEARTESSIEARIPVKLPALPSTGLEASELATIACQSGILSPEPETPGATTDLEAREEARRQLDLYQFDNHESPEPEVEKESLAASNAGRELFDLLVTGRIEQPQEKALATDMLLSLLPSIDGKTRAAFAERLAIMENTPPLLVATLARDTRDEVAGTILERCQGVSDYDLIHIIGKGDETKRKLIARRRTVSSSVVDALVTMGDEATLLGVIRNPGAIFSSFAFRKLCIRAKTIPAIQAKLVTRSDTPTAIAFELFWQLPPDLRRLVLTRFLIDSSALVRILKTGSEVKYSSSKLQPTPILVDLIVQELVQGHIRPMARVVSRLLDITSENACRILSDEDGEPLAVLMKALGVSRARFIEIFVKLFESPGLHLNKKRKVDDLFAIFDQLSINKAKVLLAYWDWYSTNTGPYSNLA